MKLTTYNIQYGFGADGQYSLQRIADTIRDRDLIAVLERIGPQRWRLVLPWPQYESNLDLIELVPA